MNFEGLLGKSALFLIISAILHVLYLVVNGFTPLAFLIIAALYVGFAWGLSKGWRWLSYIVFVVMLFGIIASYIANEGGLLGLVAWGITISDLIVAICLFIYLWRNRSLTA